MLRWIALVLALWASPALAQPVIPLTQASVPITVSTAATVQLVAAPAQTNQAIVVTAVDVIAAGTTNVQFVYGTGTNCGTGTTALVGVMTFVTGQVLNLGTGVGALWVVPPGKDLCITIGTAGAPGSLSYSQF